ncbi:MAG TPA: hypothetical protein VF169_23770 [Albitalea sp.]|uniref:hypothetical protein n=1 Tax=Piscinibacter sp. TaxID=1903157 RepID=UPI002ECFD104
MNRSFHLLVVCALVALAAIVAAVAIVHAELGLAHTSTRSSASEPPADPPSTQRVAAASGTS